MALFKILGLIIVFLACSGAGFINAQHLKNRKTTLDNYVKGLSTLCNCIRHSNDEAFPLFFQCFGEKNVYIQNGKLCFCKDGLNNKDIALLEEFFSGFGFSSGEEEFERSELFKALITQRLNEADDNFNRLFKLYRSLGVLAGLFVCIFLL